MTGRPLPPCAIALPLICSAALAQTAAPEPEQLAREAMQKLVEKQAREAELKAIEERLAGNAEARAKLEAEIAAIRADRAGLNKALLETTARTQAAEQRIGALEQRLSLLQSSEAAIRRSLEGRRGLIAEVLAALQRIGRRPPPAVLVRPEDILEAVRASMLLGAVVPDLRQEIEILGTDLAELVRLRDGIASERKAIAGEMEQLAGRAPAPRLAGRGQARARGERRRRMSRRSAASAANSRRRRARLRDFVERIEKEISVANRAAEAARQALERRNPRAARAHGGAGLPGSGPARPQDRLRRGARACFRCRSRDHNYVVLVNSTAPAAPRAEFLWRRARAP